VIYAAFVIRTNLRDVIRIGVKQAVFAQAFGGIFFAIFGGQPMIILVTTVPIAIYVKSKMLRSAWKLCFKTINIQVIYMVSVIVVHF